jgi:hypothetical protein
MKAVKREYRHKAPTLVSRIVRDQKCALRPTVLVSITGDSGVAPAGGRNCVRQ